MININVQTQLHSFVRPTVGMAQRAEEVQIFCQGLKIILYYTLKETFLMQSLSEQEAYLKKPASMSNN